MGTSSPLMNHLLDTLGEEPVPGSSPNASTLNRQAVVAEAWLLEQYLGAWLELIGGMVDCDYPIAKAYRVNLRALARMKESLAIYAVEASSPGARAFLLENIRTQLRSTLVSIGGCPAQRSMQWGVWARDVPAAIAYGFSETGFLDPVICEGISPCCMFAAFLISQIVTDDGVAEEIGQRMFESMPRELLTKLAEVPVAPEA